MSKGFWKSAIVGGLVVFIWGIVSWMLLPWHTATTHRFADESAVTQAIESNAPESGVYFLPSCNCHTGKERGLTREQIKSEMEDTKARMRRGPIVFASIHLEGRDPGSVGPFIGSLIIQIIGAAIATWLLLQTKAMTYMKRVRFITIIGLFAGVVSALPAWNWMCFSSGWTIVSILDLLIGWFLGGLVIGKLAFKK